MEANHIYIYLFDGYSDWEIGYLMPELIQDSRYQVLTVSDTGADVTSVGGLKVKVDCSLEDIDISTLKLLILPGGEMWEKSTNNFNAIDRVVYGIYKYQLPIAAICGATLYLAQKGMLDYVKHTSNALFYMKGFVPTYHGEKNYVDQLVVRDQNVVTASGIGATEFSREVMKVLDFNSEYVDRWFQLFKYGIFPAA
ncbi:glutamine amidotransferase [Myroides odoratimimus]|uniref:DJ-1/PfpI domain-containing protein n=2 Tax=Myroides odoratimimus TaxID=76832 RepID=A0AAI8G460_9FLAO|nr:MULTISPECIES: type 1 glutamine amidotransferase family protein [Myroides]ALU25378.1 hypothetical protein AS202_04075 [Myroides odoratimimus]APA91389.1 glutamine amidotransferase [Myroides sp. ZB35]EHO05254.1 hypothetical protein HMPREF9715_03324 [Myroides odoratimimus CIP 101113]EKB02926.1 hypothetical protein HMPREF9711_03003 [Myroides odoratimimus CCUG 3837]EPH08616.1 hypothetical protein HMPREF9713_03073 [Myroides odoratimimus CCUG 12700]